MDKTTRWLLILLATYIATIAASIITVNMIGWWGAFVFCAGLACIFMCVRMAFKRA